MYKICMLKNLNKGRDIPCFFIGRFNIVKKSIFPKFIYRCNVSIFVDIDKLILKFTLKCKGNKVAILLEEE